MFAYFRDVQASLTPQAALRCKSVAGVQKEMEDAGLAEASGSQKQGLKRVLRLHDLLAYGVGSTVGAGIYSVIAVAVALSGPSITISFLICCLACICTGLVYAEFAVRIPQAGSAYTFAYTSFGELLAWTVGWALTLEYCISAAATARSFGSYIDGVVASFGAVDPFWVNQIATGTMFVISPTSALLVLAMSALLLLGVKNSSRFNVICTSINLCVLAFFIIAGAVLVNTDNWSLPASNATIFSNGTCTGNTTYAKPIFLPIPEPGGFMPYGFGGLMKASGLLFFSYLGFDAVSTLAEESARPKRDLPLGILGSLLIAGGVYVAISLVLIGMVPWNYFQTSCDGIKFKPNLYPLSFAFDHAGWLWASKIMAFGALLATTISTFTALLGQPRVFFRMSRDGLFFPLFGNLNPKTGIPTLGTIIIGVLTAIVALLVPIDSLSDFISLGSLYAFTTVDCALLMYRYGDGVGGPKSRRTLAAILLFCVLCAVAAILFTQSPAPFSFSSPMIISGIIVILLAIVPVIFLARSHQCEDAKTLVFRTPLVPFVPCLGIAVNVAMMCSRSALTYYAFLVWFTIGVLIYAFYGARNSRLRQRDESSEESRLLATVQSDE